MVLHSLESTYPATALALFSIPPIQAVCRGPSFLPLWMENVAALVASFEEFMLRIENLFARPSTNKIRSTSAKMTATLTDQTWVTRRLMLTGPAIGPNCSAGTGLQSM